jgi:hypothetical protein
MLDGSAQIRPRIPGQSQQPQQPPQRKEPKQGFPKAVVNTKELTFSESIAMAGTAPAFLLRKEKAEEQLRRNGNPLVLKDGAVVALATALRLRMIHVVRQCVWFAKRRCNEMLPPDRTIVDVPLARFALLEAENRILAAGRQLLPHPPENCDPLIEKLRTEAISVVSARFSTTLRDELSALAKDNDEQQEEGLDCSKLVDLVGSKPKNTAVTVSDVCAFLEIDSVVHPLRVQKIMMLRGCKKN